MQKIDLDKMLTALNIPARKALVQLLITEPKTVKELFKELPSKGISLKYRDSVYKNLEKLVDSGLVEKFYNDKKGICYQLWHQEILIDLVVWSAN
jgi:Fe2+ or Zn2+ uptake regulation protein